MFCPKCGEKNSGYSVSCTKCGMSLAEVQRILEKEADKILGEDLVVPAPEPADEIPVPEKTEQNDTIPPAEDAVIPGHLTAVELKDMGNEYYKQGKYLDAIDCYEKAIAMDQYFKEAWFNKSLALKKIDREDQSKVCWGIYKRLEALERKGD
jgi:tetratricopeptide (TPR) repeat protein